MAVYFIEADGLDLVKIGFAANPWRRLNKLRSDCPARAEIIGIVEGGADVEAAMHERFQEHRHRGEWFKFAPSIRAYVSELPSLDPPMRGKLSAGVMEAHRRAIIRFGGMREMARKLEHANHTTVQGWWDRSRIPAGRWSEINAAAKRHGVEFDMDELSSWIAA